MHAIVFVAAGLFFLYIAHYGRRTFDHFQANSTRTRGRVVDTVQVESRLQGRTHHYEVPIVEYTAGNGTRLRFQGEVDIHQHGLSPNDTVSVLVSLSNPRIAKLEQGSREKVILLRAMTGLGIATCVVGVYLFDPSDYRLEFLTNPWVLGGIAVGGFVLFSRVLPVIRHLRGGKPVYAENAREVSARVDQA